jgi:hypothetical protein
MPFNAKTFDLSSRHRFLDAWVEAARLLDNDERAHFWPIGKKHEAHGMLHKMNKTRAAFRAQKTPAFLFDHIEVRVVSRIIDHKKVYGLRFVDRGTEHIDFSFIIDPDTDDE